MGNPQSWPWLNDHLDHHMPPGPHLSFAPLVLATGTWSHAASQSCPALQDLERKKCKKQTNWGIILIWGLHVHLFPFMGSHTTPGGCSQHHSNFGGEADSQNPCYMVWFTLRYNTVAVEFFLEPLCPGWCCLLNRLMPKWCCVHVTPHII